MKNIILFDGVCNFCNGAVQFIVKRDKKGAFKFASLQSEAGKELLSKCQLPQEIDSFVLVENNKCYIKSTAALRVCQRLKTPWNILSIFRVIPTPIRNTVYEYIAENRYKWFGKKEDCMLPSKELRDRFLEGGE